MFASYYYTCMSFTRSPRKSAPRLAKNVSMRKSWLYEAHVHAVSWYSPWIFKDAPASTSKVAHCSEAASFRSEYLHTRIRGVSPPPLFFSLSTLLPLHLVTRVVSSGTFLFAAASKIRLPVPCGASSDDDGTCTICICPPDCGSSAAAAGAAAATAST